MIHMCNKLTNIQRLQKSRKISAVIGSFKFILSTKPSKRINKAVFLFKNYEFGKINHDNFLWKELWMYIILLIWPQKRTAKRVDTATSKRLCYRGEMHKQTNFKQTEFFSVITPFYVKTVSVTSAHSVKLDFEMLIIKLILVHLWSMQGNKEFFVHTNQYLQN